MSIQNWQIINGVKVNSEIANALSVCALESPRKFRRLHLLERMESWDEETGIRQSFGSGLCGWFSSSGHRRGPKRAKRPPAVGPQR